MSTKQLIPNYRSDHPEEIIDNLMDDPAVSFPAPTNPKNMHVTIESPLKKSVIFESLIGTETLSEPFEFQVRMYSENVAIDFKKILGKNLAVCFATVGKKKIKKYFAGIVSHVRSLNSFVMDPKSKKQIAFYSVTLRPQFWCAKLSKQSRIFMKKKTIDIIEQVLKEEKVKFTNKATSLGKTLREYCVQYNESNFDFVSRLMEEEGIFYYFQYSASGEKMILAGENKAADVISTPYSLEVVRTDVLNCITLFNSQEQITAKKFSAIDYDYMKPETLLKSTGNGKGLGGLVYEYPGQHLTSSIASKVGKRRLTEINWPQSLTYGRSTALEFAAGSSFKLEKHPRKSLNTKYLLYKVHHHLRQRPHKNNRFIDKDNQNVLYSNEFTALPMNIPFTPLRNTPKPQIVGNQTALVVGPSNKEIEIDKKGRVLIQFHWDTIGKKDGKTSAPVRYMQGWAGPGFGFVAVPRIGMEVVVSFMNGDPDRPLIIGCVYNGKNEMPSEVTKEPRVTIFKTKTSPKDGKKANIFSFNDSKDKEKITMNATKDFELSSIAEKNLFLVKQDGDKTTNKLEIKDGLLSTTIKKGEKKTNINEGNYSILLKKGSLKITLENGDNVITLKKGNYILNVDSGSITVKAKKNISFQSKANIIMKANKNIELDAKGAIKITAKKNITEKATMDIIRDAKAISDKAKMDVKIKGLNIAETAQVDCKRQGLNIKDTAKVQAAISGSVKATLEGKVMAEVKGGATAAVKGAITMLG